MGCDDRLGTKPGQNGWEGTARPSFSVQALGKKNQTANDFAG
jgi:hypothetical protein